MSSELNMVDSLIVCFRIGVRERERGGFDNRSQVREEEW